MFPRNEPVPMIRWLTLCAVYALAAMAVSTVITTWLMQDMIRCADCGSPAQPGRPARPGSASTRAEPGLMLRIERGDIRIESSSMSDDVVGVGEGASW